MHTCQSVRRCILMATTRCESQEGWVHGRGRSCLALADLLPRGERIAWQGHHGGIRPYALRVQCKKKTWASRGLTHARAGGLCSMQDARQPGSACGQRCGVAHRQRPELSGRPAPVQHIPLRLLLQVSLPQHLAGPLLRAYLQRLRSLPNWLPHCHMIACPMHQTSGSKPSVG